MDFELSRLRRGELIVGVSSALLLAFTFLLTWYGIKRPLGWTAATLGVPTSFNGWHSLSHVRWLILVTALSGLALAYFQATRRAPALPVSLSVIVLVLAALTVLAVLYRVLINAPGPGNLDQKAGAYLGLLSAIGILVGGYQSIRDEGISPQDAPAEIETVDLRATADPRIQ